MPVRQSTDEPVSKLFEAADKPDHELKCWPQFFSEIEAGRKKHDLRRNDDRKFKVGDKILLREFDPKLNNYTGRSMMVQVTYVTSSDLPCALSKDALHPNFCILSIQTL
ncbi:DUF3850 domain-containing protein [Bradyrhizobium sp. CCBAU 51765]|uniref:DUF3850 domain-containing protein n=1 Tax=Bradyrhizobium sp. CCBAU 51765 TaxID=1325102 RepID=UPI0018C191E1|nr:DUF3850 domain-containing protein [Bradyrhizobium sp. CCBAU 51765]QOZ06641.1 hypothetical protein XH96_03245 [Bradyrhizobium sp. CCBAU 51765]